MLTKSKPEEAKRLLELAQQDVRERYAAYQALAAQTNGSGKDQKPAEQKPAEQKG